MVSEAHIESGRALTSRIAGDEIAPCLSFDLNIEHDTRATQDRHAFSAEHLIVLTASFGSHRYPILGGSVDFGVRKAELHIKTVRGFIPPASCWPEHILQTESEIDRERRAMRARRRTGGLSLRGGVGEKGVAASAGVKNEESEERRQEFTDRYSLSERYVECSGSPTRVVWQFNRRPDPDHKIIKGRLNGKVIGHLENHKNSGLPAIDAHCEIEQSFIEIVDTSGFLAGLAASSRLLVLRALVRKQIHNWLKSCLSPVRVEARLDG